MGNPGVMSDEMREFLETEYEAVRDVVLECYDKGTHHGKCDMCDRSGECSYWANQRRLHGI